MATRAIFGRHGPFIQLQGPGTLDLLSHDVRGTGRYGDPPSSREQAHGLAYSTTTPQSNQGAISIVWNGARLLHLLCNW